MNDARFNKLSRQVGDLQKPDAPGSGGFRGYDPADVGSGKGAKPTGSTVQQSKRKLLPEQIKRFMV